MAIEDGPPGGTRRTTPPASPAEREQYAWDTCAQLVRSFNALDEHQRGGLLAAIALYRNQRSLATPPASPADMAAFGASDAACYLYPGADQQAERAAFCEGAAHAVSTPPATPPACPAEPDKFRKKPVVVVAHRLGDDGWPDEIWDGVTRNEIILHLDRDAMKRVTGHAEIRTMEGVMRANVGDWIIRGVKGEFYPCKPDIFAATYEPATSPASPAATDEEVARMVERLRKPVYTFHINEKGGPNITVEGENRFAMEREVSLLADAGREAADLLARVAKERDEWRLQAKYETDVAAAEIDGRKTAEQRAEAAEKVLAIANRGGLDLLYAVRKAIGWTDKHALSLLPDECARLKKAAVRNAPIWPGKDFDHSQPGGFDGPTGAD